MKIENMRNTGLKLKLSDRIGLKFILGSIRGLSKQKLMGILSYTVNPKTEKEKQYAPLIEKAVIDEWLKRNYDLKELENYFKILRGSDNEKTS